MRDFIASNEISNVIDTIKTTNSEVASNLEHLKETISMTQNEIENNASFTYNLVQDSLKNLKDLIDTKTEELDNHDLKLEKEKINLRVNRYAILVRTKNKLLNYELANIDEIFAHLDNYLSNIEDVQNNLLREAASLLNNDLIGFNSLADAIAQEMITYRDALNDFNKQTTSFLNNIVLKLGNMENLYLLAHNDLEENLLKNEEEFNNDFHKYLGNHPEIQIIFEQNKTEILNTISDHLNQYSKTLENILEEYQIEQEKNFKEFEELSNNEVKQIEEAFSLLYTERKDLFNNYEEIFKETKTEILNNKYLSSLSKSIKKLENIADFKLLQKKVTNEYRLRSNALYKKYRKIEKDLEKKYLNEKLKIEKNDLLFRYVIKKDPISAQIEQELFLRKIYEKIQSLYIEKTNKDIDYLFEFEIAQEKIYNAIKKIGAQFEYEKSYLTLSLQLSINKSLSILNNNIKSIEASKHARSLNIENQKNLLLNYIDKMGIVLKYQLLKVDLNKKYITAKSHLTIEHETFLNTRDEDLLEPRSELERILAEYEINAANTNTLYENERLFLNENKVRLELNNLSSYEFMIHALEHQVLIATNMFDQARKDFDLRIKAMDTVISQAIDFNQHQINKIVEKYLIKLEDLNYEKELKLKDIVTKYNLNREKDYEIEYNYTPDVNKILDEYQKEARKIHYLMHTDPQIIECLDNITYNQETALKSIEESQRLRDQALESSLTYLKEVERQIEEINNNFSKDMTMDYLNTLERNYLRHLEDIEKLEKALDLKTNDLIITLNQIAKDYDETSFTKRFKALIRHHNIEFNKIISSYKKELIENDKYHNVISNSYEVELDKTLNDFYRFVENEKARQKTLQDSVTSNISIYDDNFKKKCLRFDEELKDSIESIVEARLDDKDEFKKESDLLSNKYEKLIKDYRKLLKSSRRFYRFEYLAIKDSTKTKVKEINKRENAKYREATVYDLSGK